MEIPPITDQEVDTELARLRVMYQNLPRYIAKNMVMIRKCFGGQAYIAALNSLHLDQSSTAGQGKRA